MSRILTSKAGTLVPLEVRKLRPTDVKLLDEGQDLVSGRVLAF